MIIVPGRPGWHGEGPIHQQQPCEKPQGRRGGTGGTWERESAGCWSLEGGTLVETDPPLRGVSAPGCGRSGAGAWRWRWRAPRGLPTPCPSPLPSQHLQQHESGVEGESCYYHCVLCNYSTKAKLNLIQHVRSMKHQRSESLRKLQRLQKGLPEEDEDLGQIFTIRRCPSTEPGEWSRGPGRPGVGEPVAGCYWFSCPSPTSQGTLVFQREHGEHSCPFSFFFKPKELSTAFLQVSRAAAQGAGHLEMFCHVLSPVPQFLWF